jgi:nondiscriminating glutamyl-tRNA synthetase
MENGKIRVRFAPSPTGELHIGNARTALYNWLFARHHQGTFVLRIEDTDQQRSTEIFKSHLLQDLQWLAIDWDEGPDKGGPFGPYLQSQRFDIYNKYLHDLIDRDLVYPCYCTEEELDTERRNLLAHKKMPRYMGKCRGLNQEERRCLEKEGRKPAYRFKVRTGTIVFDDHIRGQMRFDGEAIGDFIVMRSNGLPAYNFAVVIDDHLMKISHIVRGEDHLSNTASQLLLYEALNFEPPQFYHHSLILGLDHAKLSKRHGDVSVSEFRNKGYLAKAVVNYLSLLGSSLGEGKEICPVETIIQLFSMEKVGKSGALFDEDKLKWMNAIYVRSCNIEKLRAIVRSSIQKDEVADLTDEKLDQFIELIRPNIETITEVNDYLGIISDQSFIITEDAQIILNDKKSAEILSVFYHILDNIEEYSEKHLREAIKELSKVTGAKGKELYMPIRAAITGMTKGPELDELFRFMGKGSILNRIRSVINEIDSGRNL